MTWPYSYVGQQCLAHFIRSIISAVSVVGLAVYLPKDLLAKETERTCKTSSVLNLSLLTGYREGQKSRGKMTAAETHSCFSNLLNFYRFNSKHFTKTKRRDKEKITG